MSTNTLSKITDPATIATFPEPVAFLNSLYDAITGDLYLREISLLTTFQKQSAGSEEFKWSINTGNQLTSSQVQTNQYEIFNYSVISEEHIVLRSALVLVIAQNASVIYSFINVAIFDTISIRETTNNVIGILLNGNIIVSSAISFGTSVPNDRGFQVLYLS